MVEISDFDMEAEDKAFKSNEIGAVYPKVGEGLLEFLHRYKAEDSESLLFNAKISIAYKKTR